MNLKYWKQFEDSGKIEDYLAFVSGQRQEAMGGEPAEENGHAGIYLGDRNRAKAVPGGGV